MSLNYELGRIANWKNLDNAEIEAMCYLSMFIGMPVIASKGKDSWERFLLRAIAWQTVAGRLNYPPITAETVQRFVGLRTNATRISAAAFQRKLGAVAMADAERRIVR